MKTFRLVLLMLLCIAGGAVAGYRVALHHDLNRLQRNKTLVRRSHEKVWSERNIEAATNVAREIYSNDVIVHDWTGDSTGGLAELAKGVADNRTNFPDWTEKVETMVAEGDFVAARFLSTGTQERDLPAVPRFMPVIPNRHRFLRMPEIEIFRISNGKLAEQWDISDGWDANVQMGFFDPDHWPDSVCGPSRKP